VAHRAQVELDERKQLPVLLVAYVDECVGGERSSTPVGAERFARVAFKLEVAQPQTTCLRLRDEQHIQLRQSRGVGEELRVGLRPLAAARHRLATRERVRHPRRPVVERRGALVAVGTAPPEQTKLG
jgi:hypothetical protein